MSVLPCQSDCFPSHDTGVLSSSLAVRAPEHPTGPGSNPSFGAGVFLKKSPYLQKPEFGSFISQSVVKVVFYLNHNTFVEVFPDGSSFFKIICLGYPRHLYLSQKKPLFFFLLYMSLHDVIYKEAIS